MDPISDVWASMDLDSFRRIIRRASDNTMGPAQQQVARLVLLPTESQVSNQVQDRSEEYAGHRYSSTD